MKWTLKRYLSGLPEFCTRYDRRLLAKPVKTFCFLGVKKGDFLILVKKQMMLRKKIKNKKLP